MTTRLAVILTLLLARCVVASADPLEIFLEQHCLECHSGKTPEAGLDLATMSRDASNPEAFDRLSRIHDRVAKHEMPPSDHPQPSGDEVVALTEWLDRRLHDVDMAVVAREGRASTRRLTNSEYENTLRDLLALPHLSIRDTLSADGRVAGYDKIGDGLDLSPVHLAAYTAAAEEAVTAAIATRSTPPPVMRRRIYPASISRFKYNLTRGSYVLLADMRPDPALPFVPPAEGADPAAEQHDAYRVVRNRFYDEHNISDSTSAVGMLMSNVGDTFASLEASPIHSGLHRLRLSVWGFTWDKGEVKPVVPSQAVVIRGHREGRENREGRTLATLTAASLSPREHEIETWLDAAESLVLDPVSLPWSGGTVNIAGPGRWATAHHVGPGVAIDWIDYEGPLHPTWPPESHRRLFGDLPIEKWPASATQLPPMRKPVRRQTAYWPRSGVDMPAEEQQPPLETVHSAAPDTDAERLIAGFLPRAFRRPVTPDEIAAYVALARTRLAAGDCFEDAMRHAYVAILTSPEFLFHRQEVESDAYALACRISYWLWNGPPDDTLIAAAGRLRDPVELRKQVDRLLSDPKSSRFIDDFVSQWLALHTINDTTPDPQLYPEYSLLLHESMVAETRSFFRELVTEDLPIRTIVDASFTMLTQRLAEHYGIPGVDGVDVRRVDVPALSHRGGLLTQAAILKLTANGTTTSPVKRGVWVMDRLLDDPAPPPPPGISAIDPDTRGATTVREQLALHRTNTSCAACHAKIDPAGFALEAFDPVGGFRTFYRALGQGEWPPEKGHTAWGVNYRVGPPVDASGELPDGRTFAGIDELKHFLAADEARLARAFVGHMARYATGVDLRYSDRREIDAIVASAHPSRYGVRSLLHALAASRLVTSR